MRTTVRNPFSKIRTEQMGDQAWKYFVKEPSIEIGEKPVVFEGSRGTGKTMFFRCNSWQEKYAEATSKGLSLEGFLQQTKHIGFYYKVDGRFVKSFDKKNIDDGVWIGIFNAYFNAIISKEIIGFLQLLINENLIKVDTINSSLKYISKCLDINIVTDLNELKDELDNAIIKIEQFSNNTERQKPIGLNAGTVIEKLLLSAKENILLKGTTFHIFVDEFEVLNVSQQIELNTLLKQSNSDLVYDYGVITRGFQTKMTGSGQEIRPKDDYVILRTDKYDFHESEGYNNLLNEICKKRLTEELDRIGIKYDSKHVDINYYLKNYGKRYEENLFKDSLNLSKVKNMLKEEVVKQSKIFNYSENEIEEINQALSDCSIVNQRIHIALLKRRGKYSVNPKDLVNHKRKQSKEYADWIHNMETHAIYLLCHELQISKKYHGFQVYSALSSGVVRSFLELTEYAFDYAINNSEMPFSFETPRELTIDEQTKAVYFVSKFKISEIDSYEPGGFQLKGFTIALGKIFNSYHTDSDATLGEVEQNHFTTQINDLRSHRADAYTLLDLAIRHKILEEGDSNKTKNGIEFFDYHINHIYCPAFGISHLRKRKIVINYRDLSKLLCGNDSEIEEAVGRLTTVKIDDQPNLFSEADDIPGEV